VRALNRFNRMYIDGRDYSGAARSFGPLVYDPQEVDMTAPMSDAAHGYLPDLPVITPTVFNGIMDNTATTGLQVNLTGGGVGRCIMAIIGGEKAPVIGSPSYNGIFLQTGYEAVNSNGMIAVTIPFSDWDEVLTAGLNYKQPWGYLTHVMGSETAVNSANTNVDGAAQTTLGGVMWYQVTSITGGTGVHILLEDSADGSTGWATVTGSSQSVLTGAAPVAGFTQLAINQTVRRYVRWQITLDGGATAVTFAQSFIRGNGG